MTFGERVLKLRTEKGMTQDELAIMVGYKSRSTIAKIESGERDPHQSMIVSLAQALGVTPAYLMGWTDEAIETHIALKKLDNPDNTSQQVKDSDKFIDEMISLSDKPYDDKPTFPPKRGRLHKFGGAKVVIKKVSSENGTDKIVVKKTTSEWERILNNMSDDSRKELQDYAELLLLKQDQDGQGD